ncbi:hypothetical protein MMC17_006904 [Xylographa soralifera]|nr:hypothetical protein [Xylographa soralifera]
MPRNGSRIAHQDISGTSATDGSIALAGHFPNLTNVTIGTRESSRPPKPSSTVPFQRDPDFVDRGDLLSQVDERCSQPAGRAALIGLGGVGKSQLAIEYAYRTRERSSDIWVFWVHASNAARFEQGYRDIAYLINIPGREDPKANILKLVHDWLRGCEGKWLLILDNVDNTDLLSEAGVASQGGQGTGVDSVPQQPMIAYLPQSQNGSILVTGRNRAVALELVEETDILSVQPMALSHALALFEKKLGPVSQSEDTAELAAPLEFMPLAIVQAAAYFSQRAPRYSVQQYLETFRESDGKKTSLLNYKGGQLRRDWQAQNSIIITWQISFEYTYETSPSAADLLSLMSFLDRQGIPEALVRNRAANEHGHRSLEGDDKYKDRKRKRETTEEEEEDEEEDSLSGCSEDDGFEDDVQILRNYSFLSIGTGRTFEMHALVQLAMRKWLEAHRQVEAWKQHYIKILSADFPDGDYENWTYYQALFPHAKSAVTQRPKGERSLREWALLLSNAGCYAWKKGNLADAVNLSEMAMEKEAQELNIQIKEIYQKVLGEEYPNTLTSINNLALIYQNQGRWKEAEELNIRTLKTKQKVLGGEHPSTLISMDNLAEIYRNQGRWKEAEELIIQIKEISQKVLGKEHPNMLFSMHNLALIYQYQGRWKEAEELNIQTLKTKQKVLGEEHPSTLISMHISAIILKNKGEAEKAIALMEDCVGKQKQVIGQDHPFTKMSEDSLSSWCMESLH